MPRYRKKRGRQRVGKKRRRRGGRRRRGIRLGKSIRSHRLLKRAIQVLKNRANFQARNKTT